MQPSGLKPSSVLALHNKSYKREGNAILTAAISKSPEAVIFFFLY